VVVPPTITHATDQLRDEVTVYEIRTDTTTASSPVSTCSEEANTQLDPSTIRPGVVSPQHHLSHTILTNTSDESAVAAVTDVLDDVVQVQLNEILGGDDSILPSVDIIANDNAVEPLSTENLVISVRCSQNRVILSTAAINSQLNSTDGGSDLSSTSGSEQSAEGLELCPVDNNGGTPTPDVPSLVPSPSSHPCTTSVIQASDDTESVTTGVCEGNHVVSSSSPQPEDVTSSTVGINVDESRLGDDRVKGEDDVRVKGNNGQATLSTSDDVTLQVQLTNGVCEGMVEYICKDGVENAGDISHSGEPTGFSS